MAVNARNLAANRSELLEIVGAFQSSEALERAISDLSSAGWDRSELSILAQKGLLAPDPPTADQLRDAALGDREARSAVVSEPDVRQGRTLATGMAGVIGAFLVSGATVLTGGTVLAAAIGAAAAGGGAAAAVNAIGQWMDKSRGEFLHEQVEQGGIMLWVVMRRPEQETLARDILGRNGAIWIEVVKTPLKPGESVPA